MDIENLIVLMYGHTNLDAIELPAKGVKEKELKINLEKQTWDYLNFEQTQIGDMRPIDDPWKGAYKTGIIGVYDSTNPTHMKNMESHKKIATSRVDDGSKSENW